MMGEAAKKWMVAVEDPSGLVTENSRLRDDLGERDEHIARFEMRYENDASRWEETEKDLRASCVRVSRELAASVEYHANFRDKIDKALGQPRGDGDILSAILSEIESLKKQLTAAPHWVPVTEWIGDYGWHYVAASNGLCYDAKRKGSRWFPAYAEASLDVDVTHVLVGLNPPVSNEDPRGGGDLLPESERLDRLTRECMRDEFDRMIEVTRKMDEPPDCNHEKTRTVLGTPYDSHSIECVDCGCDVTHPEPVKSRKFGNCGRKNCRGVSHQVNHGYCRECQSAIDEITDSLTVLSAKPKRDLIVAESPDGMWRVWEQKTAGDYAMVAGPFHDSELANAAVGEIRAEEGTSVGITQQA